MSFKSFFTPSKQATIIGTSVSLNGFFSKMVAEYKSFLFLYDEFKNVSGIIAKHIFVLLAFDLGL